MPGGKKGCYFGFNYLIFPRGRRLNKFDAFVFIVSKSWVNTLCIDKRNLSMKPISKKEANLLKKVMCLLNLDAQMGKSTVSKL